MEGLTLLLNTIKEAPTFSTLTIVFVAVVFSLYLNSKKVNIEGLTSINKSQIEQINNLMSQVKQLTADMAEARSQIQTLTKKDLESQNQILELKRKNSELEMQIKQLRSAVKNK